VRYAAQLAQEGAEIDDIATKLDLAIENTRTFGMLGDLDYAVRGGRVPRSRKIMAQLLRINPILKTFPDGRIASGGLLFGRHHSIGKFARYIARQTQPATRYLLAIGHAGDRAAADELLSLLADQIDGAESAIVTELGTALGAHGGRGTLVVALQETETRSDTRQLRGTPAPAIGSH
ncbi:MAG: DegV family protein, partial [Gammaproteobacteria bacterium]